MAKRSISSAKHRAPAAELLPPQDLFTKCQNKERKLRELSVRDDVHQAFKDYLFVRHPLFVSVLPGRYQELCVKLAGERHPFDFSIIHQKDDQISEPEWRYGKILEHLKKLATIELRLLFIARWLKQEGVCEPEDIIPSALLGRVLAQFLKKERISLQDLRHWYLVKSGFPTSTVCLLISRKPLRPIEGRPKNL